MEWDASDDWLPGEYVFGDYCYITEECMEERWKESIENPNYWISDCGRVYNITRQHFLNGKRGDRLGHRCVMIRTPEGVKYPYIHRMVAEVFIDNPENHPIVRHLNDCPDDNHYSNLAWGTQLENIHDSIRNGHAHFLTDEEREIGLVKSRRPIKAIYPPTGEEMRFDSIVSASKYLNIWAANIGKVLHGERPLAGGWCFEYLPKEN